MFIGRKRGLSSASASSASEDEDEIVPFKDAKPSRRSNEEEDEVDAADDDTFIVEDDNSVAPELPAEFSMNTYQDLLHHFKIICQYFVHISVHPSDDRQAVITQFSKSTYLLSANCIDFLNLHFQTNIFLCHSRLLEGSSSV